MLDEKIQNSISTDQLYKEYDWYQHTFPPIVQESCDEFFDNNFKLELIGISKNINCLMDNESCFVTKIRINQEYDMFFRLTDKALDIILNKVLGQSKNKFNINKISELEAKVITSFNDFMFEHLKTVLTEADPTQLKRNNFDLIHLTFIIREVEEYNKKAGKVIITLPLGLLKPEIITSNGAKFSDNSFPTSETFVDVLVGKTKFSLYDLKNLETDDVVVFENSELENITLSINGETIPVHLNPNMDILITETTNGGDNMGDTHQNIWDSIEVDMYAELDPVKISLGDLKKIEKGLVVDVAALYENKVTLRVENKVIGHGELVIVNDRYGVKITDIEEKAPAQQAIPAVKTSVAAEQQANEILPEENSASDDQVLPEGAAPDEAAPAPGNEEEEFDYSDFELEDEDI